MNKAKEILEAVEQYENAFFLLAAVGLELKDIDSAIDEIEAKDKRIAELEEELNKAKVQVMRRDETITMQEATIETLSGVINKGNKK